MGIWKNYHGNLKIMCRPTLVNYHDKRNDYVYAGVVINTFVIIPVNYYDKCNDYVYTSVIITGYRNLDSDRCY